MDSRLVLDALAGARVVRHCLILGCRRAVGEENRRYHVLVRKMYNIMAESSRFRSCKWILIFRCIRRRGSLARYRPYFVVCRTHCYSPAPKICPDL